MLPKFWVGNSVETGAIDAWYVTLKTGKHPFSSGTRAQETWASVIFVLLQRAVASGRCWHFSTQDLRIRVAVLNCLSLIDWSPFESYAPLIKEVQSQLLANPTSAIAFPRPFVIDLYEDKSPEFLANWIRSAPFFLSWILVL